MLEAAITVAEALRRTLDDELLRARRERAVIRSLDPDRLMASAGARGSFNVEVARLQALLAETLRAGAASLGVSGLTLERLVAAAPAEGKRLAALLAAVRERVAALRDLDRTNLRIAERAMASVQGHLAALDARPRGYDRHGVRAAALAVAAISKRV